MQKLNRDEEEIFVELSAEKPKLMSFIRRRAKDPNEIEDIYQEALTRLTRQLRSGEKPDDSVSYLYRIVINIINDRLRREQRIDGPEPLDDAISCRNPLPDQQVDDQQRLALFVKQLNELPVITRNIIVMRKLHGKTNVEIARQLGISAKAVEKQLNRALKAIESRMARSIEAADR